ncbi:glycoprotein endo-alpha-1,2-mannosidase-like protein isoform X1 [Styela clava]
MLVCGRRKWRTIIIFLVIISALCIFPLYSGILHEESTDSYIAKQNEVFVDVPSITSPDIGRHFNPKLLAGLMADIKSNKSNNVINHQKVLMKQDVDRDVVNYNVHAFYYAWYGNPGQDGEYFHWNHEYLPHWEKKISDKYPTGQAHIPPDDIGSSYYPLLGPYSSSDETVTRSHMIQMQQAGIGVLALSWYPPGLADDHGKPIEHYIPTLFDIADQYNIKVCFHIEPYKDRSPESVKENLKYIIETYGDHPAFYRTSTSEGSRKLPLVYVYDSYLIPANQWSKILKKRAEISIRGSIFDAVVIGLLVEKKHIWELSSAGFDGFYTYFAAEKFSYGSTRRYWREIESFAIENKMIFIPSIGPGYDDTSVRPWNNINSRKRNDGAYYETGWHKATTLSTVNIVSITSFNEWHEGTQIEPASPQSRHGKSVYLTYEPHDPDYYLKLTKKWSMKMLNATRDVT